MNTSSKIQYLLTATHTGGAPSNGNIPITGAPVKLGALYIDQTPTQDDP